MIDALIVFCLVGWIPILSICLGIAAIVEVCKKR